MSYLVEEVFYMKDGKFLFLCGLIGICVLAYKSCKRNDETTGKRDEMFNGEQPSPSSEADTSTIEKEYEDTKNHVTNSVKNRHEAAAKTIEESLNTIFKESDDGTAETDNSEIMNKTNNKLDDLLK